MAINSSTAPGNGGNGSPLRVKRNKVESVVESAMYGKQGNGEKKKLPLFRWFLRIRGQKQGKEG